MIDSLHGSDFLEHVNTEFQLSGPDGGPLPVRLIEVKERNDSPRLEQFSLLFRGPQAPCMEQRVYNLDHATLGSLSLFLVPVGPDGTGLCYEAVINRFRG